MRRNRKAYLLDKDIKDAIIVNAVKTFCCNLPLPLAA